MFMRVVVTTSVGDEVVGFWDGRETVDLYSGTVGVDEPAEVLALPPTVISKLRLSQNPSELAHEIMKFMRQYDPSFVMQSVIAEVIFTYEPRPDSF